MQGRRNVHCTEQKFGENSVYFVRAGTCTANPCMGHVTGFLLHKKNFLLSRKNNKFCSHLKKKTNSVAIRIQHVLFM
jgi:hypothetical protein